MSSQLVLVTHVLHPAITQGFVPAGVALGYTIIIVTDHGLAHREYYAKQQTPDCVTVLECDVFNPVAIIDLLTTQALSPDVVMSNSDHLQTACALVADYFSLASKLWQRCYESKNKAAMRQRLQDLKLPTVASTMLETFEAMPDWHTYPVVVKPREGVGSSGVALCADAAALHAHLRGYHQTNPTVPLMLEEYMPGPLFTLETLGDGYTTVAVGGFDVQLSPAPHFVELSAVWNGENSVRYRDQALAQLKRFGIGLGACHSEFIATPSGPKLVEINYRSIGDGREFLLDQLLPGGWFNSIIRLHAGESLADLAVNAGIEQTQAVIRYIVANKAGRLVRQPAAGCWDENGARWQYKPLKQAGERVHISHSNKDYLGMLVATSSAQQPLAPQVESRQAELDWEIVA